MVLGLNEMTSTDILSNPREILSNDNASADFGESSFVSEGMDMRYRSQVTENSMEL